MCALCRRLIKPGEVFNRYEIPGRFGWPGELCHRACFDELSGEG